MLTMFESACSEGLAGTLPESVAKCCCKVWREVEVSWMCHNGDTACTPADWGTGLVSWMCMFAKADLWYNGSCFAVCYNGDTA